MKKIKILLFFCNVFLLQSCLTTNYIRAWYNIHTLRADEFFSDSAMIKLINAAEGGNYKKIDEAIREGADVNGIGEDGLITPLMWTFIKSKRKGFEYLLRRGADPNYINGNMDSVITMATNFRSLFYLKKALQYGGNPDIVTNYYNSNPLHISVVYLGINHKLIRLSREEVRLLIKAGADINFKNGSSNTPIIHAATFNNYDLIYILLDAGADPLIKGYARYTILYDIEEKNINTRMPIYEWYKAVVRFLREKGIEVNVTL